MNAAGSPPRGRLRLVLGPYLALLFRVSLGAVFVVASLDKLVHPAAFAANISHYHMLPLGLVNLMALCLPWIELCAGLALIVGLRTKASLLIVGGLLAVFIVAIISAIRRGLDLSCGCFNTDPAAHRMTRWTLYWDIVWLAMSLHALVFDRGLLSLEGLWARKRARTAGVPLEEQAG